MQNLFLHELMFNHLLFCCTILTNYLLHFEHVTKNVTSLHL